MKKLITILICFMSMAMAWAQNEQVPFNGVVEDALGNPIKGAKIWVVDASWFSKSDKQGRFGLTNVKSDDVVHVMYNKKQYDIPVEGKKSMRIRIGDEVCSNSEDEALTNVGYGFVKRRESAKPSSGIKGEVLVRTGMNDILNALTGLVPGLTVTNGHALIRGVGTIHGATEPLYLIDGVQVSSLSFVNIYDVESVEVLKDGSMYGARGANGVIIVNMKNGKK